MSGSQSGWPGANHRNTFSTGLGKFGVGEKLQQVGEFFEVVTAAGFGVGLQIREQFVPGIGPGIAPKLLADEPF